MRIKKSTVFLTMFVLLLAFTGCQNESSSTDENKQTKSTESDKVIYNQKDLPNPQKLEILEDGTVEMEVQGEQQVHKTKQISGNGRYTHIGRRYFLSERQSSSFGEFLGMGIYTQ